MRKFKTGPAFPQAIVLYTFGCFVLSFSVFIVLDIDNDSMEVVHIIHLFTNISQRFNTL